MAISYVNSGSGRSLSCPANCALINLSRPFQGKARQGKSNDGRIGERDLAKSILTCKATDKDLRRCIRARKTNWRLLLKRVLAEIDLK